MLGALDPILVFQIYKKIPAATRAKIPTADADEASQKSTFAVIPIYLSETITGIYIDSESKNIDIDTDTSSLSSGEGALVNQKTLGSITVINLIAKQGSIGLTILLALSELILDKATSQEYEVTYMHGAVTVFGGLLHSFSYEQGSNDDLYKIKLELSRGRPKQTSVAVGRSADSERLGTVGTTPPATAPTVSAPPTGGSSVISPRGIGLGALP